MDCCLYPSHGSLRFITSHSFRARLCHAKNEAPEEEAGRRTVSSILSTCWGFRFLTKKSKQLFATVYTDLDAIFVKCGHYFDYYFYGISLSVLKQYIDNNRKQWNEHCNTHLYNRFCEISQPRGLIRQMILETILLRAAKKN